MSKSGQDGTAKPSHVGCASKIRQHKPDRSCTRTKDMVKNKTKLYLVYIYLQGVMLRSRELFIFVQGVMTVAIVVHCSSWNWLFVAVFLTSQF